MAQDTSGHGPDTLALYEFYAREAALLDDRRYREWLSMLSDDVQYVVPVVSRSQRRSESPGPAETLSFDLLHEDRASLELRIDRLESGLALTEHPAAATQRVVSGVLLTGQKEEDLFVRSSFMMVYVSGDGPESIFAGRRYDHLRPRGDSFQLARREVHLVHNIFPHGVGQIF